VGPSTSFNIIDRATWKDAGGRRDLAALHLYILTAQSVVDLWILEAADVGRLQKIVNSAVAVAQKCQHHLLLDYKN